MRIEIFRRLATSPPVRARTGRRAILTLYVLAAAVVVLQRGIVGAPHNVFRIFRRSFWHLVAGQNLYAAYPAEQGGAPADLFKYSPTAALLFAPIAVPPYGLALFGWSLLGALLLFRALTLVLEENQALLAALLVFPDLFAALQGCSSNAQVAALIIIAFAALERRRQVSGAVAIVVGAAMKLFPFAALTFAILHPRRARFALIVLATLVIALLLPLLVTPPSLLLQQYRWWYTLELSDAKDLAFGLSVMHLVRHWVGGTWPNWSMQLPATCLLLLPLVVRRREWQHAEFRLAFLASLLMYAVLFNHQAERTSFVIASAGVAIWCVTPPAETSPRWLRTLLAVSAVVGLRTFPLLLVWSLAQLELYGWRMRWPGQFAVARSSLDRLGVTLRSSSPNGAMSVRRTEFATEDE